MRLCRKQRESRANISSVDRAQVHDLRLAQIVFTRTEEFEGSSQRPKEIPIALVSRFVLCRPAVWLNKGPNSPNGFKGASSTDNDKSTRD